MEAVTAVKILTLLLVEEVSADDEADGNVGDDVCEDDICVVLGESTAV